MTLSLYLTVHTLFLPFMLAPYSCQQTFNDPQYKQLEDTSDWVVKARHLREDMYEIIRLAKPDNLWTLEQALKRKGVEGADRISYLIEKKRVNFSTSKTQLLELRWYDKAGKELHKDIVDDPKWELEERHVRLLRTAIKGKLKDRN
jgi:hypothetical protein